MAGSNPPRIDFQNVTITRGDKMFDRSRSRRRRRKLMSHLGPNGSGKSSLTKAITRECYPRYSGTARARIAAGTAGTYSVSA
jgi:iron complex transport system ATP-binding protein